MENTQIVQQFKEFAQKTLNNHLLELKTRYENQTIEKQLLSQAYHEHRQIYKQELNEKMESLLRSGGNEWLKGEIENMTSNFLLKLK